MQTAINTDVVRACISNGMQIEDTGSLKAPQYRQLAVHLPAGGQAACQTASASAVCQVPAKVSALDM